MSVFIVVPLSILWRRLNARPHGIVVPSIVVEISAR
jgi:hypothetical protein